MAVATPLLTERWHQQAGGPGHPGGVGKPTLTGRIRQGRFMRRYADWDYGAAPINARIAGGNNASPWQAFWTPEAEDWRELPNILSFKKDKSFENNGVVVATIEIENITYEVQGEDVSLVHLIKRGALAPYRGFQVPGRPGWPEGYQNEWYRYLERNAQIDIDEGYGGENVRSWTGLIDDIDLTSKPDRITITARDFGQALTDQEMFGWNHDPKIREPVTFVDKRSAEKLLKVGYDPEAGTSNASHPPSHATDQDSKTFWRSRTYNTYAATDFIQIRLPEGRYQSFYLWPKWAGLEAYISIFLKPRADGKPNLFGKEPVPDNGWLDVDGNAGGLPHVPGALGGVSYIKKIDTLDDQGHYHTFGVGSDAPELECGKGSILRVSFRNLPVSENYDPPPGEYGGLGYAAAITRFIAMKRTITADAKEKHKVLVDDVSDAVKVILRWAGFKEWNIENTGVRLKKPVVIGRDKKLIDAINLFKEATNYVFFMDDPSDDDLSIGIPTFRSPRVITNDEPTEYVRDTDLLTGVRVKITDAPLAYVIRMRGREVKEGESTDGTGFLFGGGSVRRVKFTFYPPWSREENRLAGLLKHVTHEDPKFSTEEDCMFACYYTALQEALESVTGVIEVPGYPGFGLDEFVMVQDIGTGMWMRLYVSSYNTEFVGGKQATYKTTLTGTWADTPDVVAMKDIINEAVKNRNNE